MDYKIKINKCPNCGCTDGKIIELMTTDAKKIVLCCGCDYAEDLDDAINSGLVAKPKFKVFISLPMRGLTLKQVKYNYEQAKMNISNMSLADKNGNIVDCDDLFFFDNIQEDLDPETSRSLDYLSNDVKMLGDADLVYFVSGWEKSRGCNIEYQICKDWDIPMIFEQGGI
jgi:hypothetical protein